MVLVVPLPPVKLRKVFEAETLGLDFEVGFRLRVEARRRPGLINYYRK